MDAELLYRGQLTSTARLRHVLNEPTKDRQLCFQTEKIRGQISLLSDCVGERYDAEKGWM